MPEMLTDQEIDNAVRKLAEFRARNAEEDFLQRYAELLISYQQLKSDYEEEKVGRERYKQLARTQERNPFVLVIIDGDGYVFRDEFLREGADGGLQAAQHLNNVIKKSLREKGLENCDVMIRVYANLANLSRILYKNRLATADKRSLSPFVANFNRSYGLTDFVDAGELKENADFKIRALLSLHAENAQCKHIYFAACHDVGYISDLAQFTGDRGKVTLIRSPGLHFHDQFTKLNLGIEELPGVFRTSSLDISTPQTRSSASIDLKMNALAAVPSPTVNQAYLAVGPRESQKICQFYQHGRCRFGDDCKNAHIDPRTPIKRLLSFHDSPPYNNYDDDFTGGSGLVKPLGTAHEMDGLSLAKRAKTDFAFQLPRKTDVPDGHVAVNKDQERLDAYMPPPSAVASSRLRELSSVTKFCNNKQLTNSCSNENCEYEHKPLPENLLPALEWLSRSLPCPKRGACRVHSCVLGHICQHSECQYRGGKIKCKLPGSAHTDLLFDHTVPDPNYVDKINPNVISSRNTVSSYLGSQPSQMPDDNIWSFQSKTDTRLETSLQNNESNKDTSLPAKYYQGPQDSLLSINCD